MDARPLFWAASATDGPTVGLSQMLDARDRRVRRQQAALARFGVPVLSLTMVMPGPVKDCPAIRTAFAAARRAVDDLAKESGWRVLLDQDCGGSTGPEALLAFDADAVVLKRALVALEDGHPMGRLWDLDVLCPAGGAIGRRVIGAPPRRCLLCGEEAHACARSHRHPLPLLLAVLRKMVDGF
ncbi:MAG: citrate lyase holo-[acyl-carrier protein] synthase [Telmatospirillum sp.]|nr:citrate lyase holo-[acyl-carrier protein] synthase [Telmatospirillum sp.]